MYFMIDLLHYFEIFLALFQNDIQKIITFKIIFLAIPYKGKKNILLYTLVDS